MKKTLLAFVLLASSITMHAQDSLKVSAHGITTELNVNPFQGQLSLNNALNQIKVRYFIENQWALRLGIIGNSKKENHNVNNPYGNNPYTFDQTRTSSTMGLNFGFERHFKGTSRLSPYVGGELTLTSKSARQKETQNKTTVTTKNAWVDYTYQYNNNGYYAIPSYSEWAYTSYGINAIAGFDYYFAKHFYFGYEFTLAYARLKYKPMSMTASGPSNPTAPNTETVKQSGSSFGPQLINGIRLGFVF
jgi:hypothetical protein